MASTQRLRKFKTKVLSFLGKELESLTGKSWIFFIQTFNPLSAYMKMDILLTVLHTFLVELVR